jgi:nuclear pore complex protein Nup160
MALIIGPASHSALSDDDARALASVLPDATLFDYEFSYYIAVSSFYAKASEVFYEVRFTQLAISVAPPELDSSALWYNVIRGYIDLAQYDEAYTALVTMPYEKL